MPLRYGAGVVNSVITKLPFEAHLPGYQYCGPGTKLKKRLARGDPGINQLDVACKEHDIAYSKSDDINERHKADKVLENAAWNRIASKDAKLGEKVAALTVSGIMKAKRKLGMGMKKRVAMRSGVVTKAKDALKMFGKIRDIKESSNIALAAAKHAVKKVGGRKRVRTPRVIPIPKQGGVLPLIPIFAGLSALGSLAGGAAGIVKAINSAKTAREALQNKNLESISLGKKGSGLYLKPYRKGLGLYFNPKN